MKVVAEANEMGNQQLDEIQASESQGSKRQLKEHSIACLTVMFVSGCITHGVLSICDTTFIPLYAMCLFVFGIASVVGIVKIVEA